jgi:hypothetical protein
MTIQSAVPTSKGTWISVVARLARREHDRHIKETGLYAPIDVCTDPCCVDYRLAEAERMP